MPVAFFDFDHTLIGTSSAKHVMAELYKQGDLGMASLIEAAYWGVMHLFSAADGERMFRRGAQAAGGLEEPYLIELSHRVFENVVKYSIFKEGIDAINEHKSRGDTVVLHTSGPYYVVEAFARLAGVVDVLCSKIIVKHGLMTREVEEPVNYGAGKVFWAEKFIAEKGLSFEGSVFYSDSYSDLPMLERAEKPVCVNPDPRLKRLAQKRNWEIRQWKIPLFNARKSG